MFEGIPYNSDLFEKPVINEINNAFEDIYDKINELDVPPLKYKYPVKDINIYSVNSNLILTNRSFSVGRELILDFTFSFKNDEFLPLYDNLLIAKTNINNPYNYWGRIVAENSLQNFRFFFNNFEIYIAGNGSDETGTTFKKDVKYTIQAKLII